MRGEHRRCVVGQGRSEQTRNMRGDEIRFEQDERSPGRPRAMPALRMPGPDPQPLPDIDSLGQMVDIVEELPLGDHDEVMECRAARATRVPRPRVVPCGEVVQGGDFETIRGTHRGTEPVQRHRGPHSVAAR